MSSVVTAFGISASIPAGWEARLFRHRGGEPTLHVATFPLPASDGEFGSRATAAMPGEALFLSLTEYRVGDGLEPGRGLFAGGPPLAVHERDLYPTSLLRPRPGHRGVQRFFSATHRAFCLYVVVSGRDPGGHLMHGLNGVLRTLRVEHSA